MWHFIWFYTIYFRRDCFVKVINMFGVRCSRIYKTNMQLDLNTMCCVVDFLCFRIGLHRIHQIDPYYEIALLKKRRNWIEVNEQMLNISIIWKTRDLILSRFIWLGYNKLCGEGTLIESIEAVSLVDWK